MESGNRVLPNESRSKKPLSVSKTAEISTIRTLVQPAVVLTGFLLLIALHLLFLSLIEKIEERTVNEQARLFIGEQIVDTLNIIESDVYKMATTLGVKGQHLVKKKISGDILKVNAILKILQDGGTVQNKIQLNLQGHDQMIREVSYNPRKGKNEYILEVIDLTPKLMKIRQKVSELMALLEQREQSRFLGDRDKLTVLETKIKTFLKILPPQFTRMKENAGRLFFDSQQRLQELQAKIQQQKSQYAVIEISLVILIIIAVVGFGILISRQVSRSNSQLRLALDEMKIARDDAEYANTAKSNFLSSMSHELRTPLNAVLGFTQLLSYNENLTVTQKTNIEEISKAGKHLLNLINDVLDLSKIESGSFELSMETIDLPLLLDDCQSLTTSLAEQQKIELSYDSLDVPVCVTADYTRLKQVILNLVSNALKYNREGGEVRVLYNMVDDNTLRITIQDTGVGIEKKRLDQVFEPFNRLGKEGSNIEGTGIGLVITRQLIELMGGVIGVNSEKGVGSTFWFELPGHINKTKDTKEEPKNSENLSASQPDNITELDDSTDILIVEDNPTNQALIRQQVELLGYSADIAMNGIEARQQLQQQSYKLILTDCNMPLMDGYQLAESIRQDEVGIDRHLPIIAITANALKGDNEKCFSAGMDDYLSKPVDIKKLKHILNKWVAEPETEELTRREKDEFSKTQNNDSPVDLSVLIEQIGDEPELYNQILLEFINSSPDMIDSILSNSKTRSADDVNFFAHKLKSSAAAVGALALAEVTAELEAESRSENWEIIDQLCLNLKTLFNDVSEFINLQVADQTSGSAQAKQFNMLKGPRILVVDDDMVTLKHITLILGNLGMHNIVKASEGHEALQVLKGLNDAGLETDLVLCDLNMPKMDGVTFIRHLAERNFQGAVGFISGMDKQVLKTVEELAKAHQLNILGILEKPVSREKLAGLIQQATQDIPQQKDQKNTPNLTREELQTGIKNGSLSVHYQPKVDVHNGKLLGVESLARWYDPSRGCIYPDIFIPLAEEYGLMEELTQSVFTQAITQAGFWRDAGMEVKIAINFSMSSFSSRLDLPEWLEEQVHKVDVDPSNIIIEVTESGLMENKTTALEVLSRIRLKGFSLSIDDFGTGYSSMDQLQRLPFSELKIDRAFVAGANSDPSKLAIFESSAELAKKLGLSVVAEGVETRKDWNLAKQLGCNLIQGFFVGRPMPAKDFKAWLSEWENSKLYNPSNKHD